ncbi:MAG: hypothetical protein KC645_10210 [Gemmatimonadetes bacterium]|nr:hypothetical protein [Gemmatimonadota bacterium]
MSRTAGLPTPDDLWRRIAARSIDGVVAAVLLRQVLAHGSPAQQASPPTPPVQALTRRTIVEIGTAGDVQERLMLGHLLDGEAGIAARRYDALIEAAGGRQADLLRRKGALFLVVDVAVAAAALERAVALAPADGTAWLGLCFARERAGDRKGGREAFEQATRHGADLTVMDEREPPLPGKRTGPSPRLLERVRPIRGRALDAAVALLPKARDRFRGLASHDTPDKQVGWDLVAAVAVAWYAFEAALDADSDDYAGDALALFAAETRRRSFSPVPPARQQAFNEAWEEHGHTLFMRTAAYMLTQTGALWEAAAAGGGSERETRGLRTRAREAEHRAIAEWVLRCVCGSAYEAEPEDRLIELGQWVEEAGKAIAG